MSDIKKTKRYDIFTFHESNRKIDPMNLEKIKRSLKSNNMLEFRPILVNSKMEVIDGQHRLYAARDLDLEIYYQVKEDAVDEDMILLNNSQKRWITADYVAYHASKGSKAHQQMKKFCEENNLNTSQFIRFSGLTSSAEGWESIRTSSLKEVPSHKLERLQKDVQNAREIISEIKRCYTKNKGFLSGGRVLEALISVSRLDGYDHKEMIEACLTRLDVIHGKVTASAYFDMFKEIYNYNKRKNRIE